MKKIFYIAISLIVLLFSNSCSSLNRIKNINRYKTIDKNIKVKNGVWIETLVDSAVLIVKYKNGKKEGKAIRLYINGEYEKLYYVKDKIDGILLRYSKEGDLILHQNYSNGVLYYEKNL